MSSNELLTTECIQDKAALIDWLKTFAAAVRARDYDAGKMLFAAEAMAFGTYGDRLDGLETLVAGQWRNIWDITRGFDFDYDHLQCGIHGNLAWVATTWNSQKEDSDGVWQNRPGRATFAFEKRGKKWLAVHSHHSLHPTILRGCTSQPQ